MASLVSLRLHPFKSYLDATLAFEPLTIIIGRNASGKSNALDALEFLSRVARGLDIRDSLDGRVDGLQPIRGGSLGAPPVGSGDHVFRTSVEMEDTELGRLVYDLGIVTDPQPRVLEEKLTLIPHKGKQRLLIESVPQPDVYRWDIDARIHSDKRGTNPRFTYSSAQSICYQVTQRLEPSSAARRLVVSASHLVLQTLLGVFHLDPVPSAMRSYVPEKDLELRRDASNLSAALFNINRRDRRGVGRYELSEGFTGDGDGATMNQIMVALNSLPEHEINRLNFVRTDLGDVMAVLEETFAGSVEQIPARQMSDGMLRMLAITTAVLGGGASLALSSTPSTTGSADQASSPTILIEELENGLHPSQAGNVLRLLLERAGQERLIVTTHSPALLNVLPGELHRGVLVVSRDALSGVTSVDRLIDLPGYQRALATDTLGGLVESGRLAEAYKVPATRATSFAEILGGF